MCLYFSFIFCFPGEFLRLVFKLSHLFFHYFYPVIQIVYWIFISKIKILTSKSLVGYYGYNILYPLCLSNDFNFSYSNILFFLLLISWSSWYQLIYLLSLVLTFIVLASLKYLMNLGESSYLYFWFPLAYRWKPASKCCWRGMEYMLGSVSQSLNSWLLEPVWEHQPHEALWFLFEQKPALPMYCLPWQNREGWGVEDISPVRRGSHSGPRRPSCPEDLASGQGAFPISHSLLCFSAFLQTFPASVWFHLPFVPLRSQLPILVWETSIKPLTFHSGCGVFFQELYLLSITSTDMGKNECSMCAQIPFWSSLWQLIQNCLPTIAHEIDTSPRQYLHLWNNGYKMGLGFNAGWSVERMNSYHS